MAKSYKGMMSDVEESSEEEEIPIKLDAVEYNLKKAERDKFKLVIEQWVRHYQEKNKKMPKDEDTSSIAEELLDYKNAEKDYLDFKLKMIEASLMKFDPTNFIAKSDEVEPKRQQDRGRRATQLLAKTFGGGFGVKAN